MKGRREFLAGSLVFTGAVVTAGIGEAKTAKFPAGLIYTKEAPGRWAGKEKTHAPVVTVEGKTVKIVTPHPMSEKHYIVRHTLVTPDGKTLGEKTFANTDTAAESSFDLADGAKGTLWATSFCNLHDFWVTEFKV